uniref:Uncharacterized protein n=1 Tax=Cacopsylla melanoneura TaxID=428564 RepID=A0A8D8TSC8_9HEMI
MGNVMTNHTTTFLRNFYIINLCNLRRTPTYNNYVLCNLWICCCPSSPVQYLICILIYICSNLLEKQGIYGRVYGKFYGTGTCQFTQINSFAHAIFFMTTYFVP